MNELRELELKMITSSISLLDNCKQFVLQSDLEQSIDYYNRVLKVFDSIYSNRKTEEKYNPTPVFDLLITMEEKHSKVVDKFEKGRYKELAPDLLDQIITYYEEIRKYIELQDSHESLGMNTQNKYYKNFVEQKLLSKVSNELLKQWKLFLPRVLQKYYDPTISIVYSRMTNEGSHKIIPQQLFWESLVPFLNPKRTAYVYSDKNMYTHLFKDLNIRQPRIMLKSIERQLYFNDDEMVSIDKAHDMLTTCEKNMVIKGSVKSDQDNFKAIEYIDKKQRIKVGQMTVYDFLDWYEGNWTLEEQVHQHKDLKTINPNKTSIVRVVTLRWKQEFHHLLSFVQIPISESSDQNNESNDIVVGLEDNGTFRHFGFDKNGKYYTCHPDTEVGFNTLPPLENINEFIEQAKLLHTRVLHYKMVSWDFVVGEDGGPIFTEMSFGGAVWRYQLASQKPLFRGLTKEVLIEAARREK
ncbi:sugar-transfer associated ATP-grasp domain-containing protein [Alkalicoccus chagannorensis]|uniref:sugar-transfer associated ATP-grasp domain-containing protein n=1 Tax=Alkalicoccus chagannorensis TaxID=427072 RepID=UPI0003FA40E9|nr:sugar-transfer associated ATP-grasp domain-containing protein [Alkalicoccus chagannorensis]